MAQEDLLINVDYLADGVGFDRPRDAVKFIFQEQDSPVDVRILDPNENLREVATEGTLDGAATDIATLVDLVGALNDTNTAIQVESASTLAVEQQTPIVVEDLTYGNHDALNGVDVSSGGSYTTGPWDVQAADDLNIAVTSGSDITVEVEWLDSTSSPNVLYTTDPAALANTQDVDANLNVRSRYMRVTFTDQSGGSNSVTGTVYAV